MNLDKIMDPSTGVGAIIIGVIVSLITYFFTKNNKEKINSIKVKDNKGFIFQDTRVGGDINVKEYNKNRE